MPLLFGFGVRIQNGEYTIDETARVGEWSESDGDFNETYFSEPTWGSDQIDHVIDKEEDIYRTTTTGSYGPGGITESKEYSDSRAERYYKIDQDYLHDGDFYDVNTLETTWIANDNGEFSGHHYKRQWADADPGILDPVTEQYVPSFDYVLKNEDLFDGPPPTGPQGQTTNGGYTPGILEASIVEDAATNLLPGGQLLSSLANLLSPLAAVFAALGQAGGYRGDFLKETPDLPKDWEIHHRYQQADVLAERYLKERGIDVHALDNLRGIDPRLHDEIDAIQQQWWRAQARAAGTDEKNIKRILPLDEVDKLVEQIDAAYGKFWVKPGATAKDIAKVKIRAAQALTATNRGNRIVGVLKKAGAALGVFGIFAFIGEQAVVAKQLVRPDPAAQGALDEFLNQYRIALDDAIENGHITQRRLNKLNDSMNQWMKAIGVSDNLRNTIRSGLLFEEGKLPNP